MSLEYSLSECKGHVPRERITRSQEEKVATSRAHCVLSKQPIALSYFGCCDV